MRRADRLFDIIQALRTAPHPVTAAALAEQLEVTARTIYRDIAALQGSRVPIEGAPGLRYVLRRGYALPQEISEAGCALDRHTASQECRDVAINRAGCDLELLGERCGGDWMRGGAQGLDDIEQAAGA